MPHEQTINTLDPEYAWPRHLPPAAVYDARPWPDKTDDRLAALETWRRAADVRLGWLDGQVQRQGDAIIAMHDADLAFALDAEKRITALERESQEHNGQLAELAWQVSALLARLQGDGK